MEIRLLEKGYKNNAEFYSDFLNDQILKNEKYFSGKIVEVKELPPFPIYMGKGDVLSKEEAFLEAFNTISRCYLSLEREVVLDELFWHSVLVTHHRSYVLEMYPNIKNDIKTFNNIILKKFDWENYIYKCILATQYINNLIGSEENRQRLYKLVVDNLDVFNYIIKYEIFRNDVFLINILNIIDELDLSTILKAKVKNRSGDERIGRRVIFEFNKSYPIVMSPSLPYEDLKEQFIEYLNYYFDLSLNKQYV